jgi:hypothetical protein
MWQCVHIHRLTHAHWVIARQTCRDLSSCQLLQRCCWCSGFVSLRVLTTLLLATHILCHASVLPLSQDCYEMPLQVTVPGQPLPLPVKLRLQATTSDLVLGPKTLDFGRVPLSEAAGVYITITNSSALPQGFSFGSKLPLGLELSPNSGRYHSCSSALLSDPTLLHLVARLYLQGCLQCPRAICVLCGVVSCSGNHSLACTSLRITGYGNPDPCD